MNTPTLLLKPQSLDEQLVELLRGTITVRAQVSQSTLPSKTIKRLQSKLNDVQYILGEALADERAGGV